MSPVIQVFACDCGYCTAYRSFRIEESLIVLGLMLIQSVGQWGRRYQEVSVKGDSTVVTYTHTHIQVMLQGVQVIAKHIQWTAKL